MAAEPDFQSVIALIKQILSESGRPMKAGSIRYRLEQLKPPINLTKKEVNSLLYRAKETFQRGSEPTWTLKSQQSIKKSSQTAVTKKGRIHDTEDKAFWVVSGEQSEGTFLK